MGGDGNRVGIYGAAEQWDTMHQSKQELASIYIPKGKPIFGWNRIF
jgi:hypothetical protein